MALEVVVTELGDGKAFGSECVCEDYAPTLKRKCQ